MRKRMNTGLSDGRLASNLRQAPQPQVPAPLPLRLRHADDSHNMLALDLLQPQNHALHHDDKLALQLPPASPVFKPRDADHFKQLGIAPPQGSASQMELLRVPETALLAHLSHLDRDALVLHEHDIEHIAMRVTKSRHEEHSDCSCPKRTVYQTMVEKKYASEKTLLLANPDGDIIEYTFENRGIRPKTEHEENAMSTLTALQQLEGKGGDVVQLDTFLESVPEAEREDFLDYLAMKKKKISPKTRYQFVDLNLELAEFQKYKDIFKASKPRRFLAIEDKVSQPIDEKAHDVEDKDENMFPDSKILSHPTTSDIMGSQSGGSLVQDSQSGRSLEQDSQSGKSLVQDSQSGGYLVQDSQSGGSLVQEGMTPAEKQRFDIDVQEKAVQALEQRRLPLVRMEAPHEINEWRIMQLKEFKLLLKYRTKPTKDEIKIFLRWLKEQHRESLGNLKDEDWFETKHLFSNYVNWVLKENRKDNSMYQYLKEQSDLEAAVQILLDTYFSPLLEELLELYTTPLERKNFRPTILTRDENGRLIAKFRILKKSAHPANPHMQ
ncbi:hypothetical protein PCANC_03438 [Puccinia coronata f. sp. avenae]|uniref:Uncharacterized protein n=1 Tax=Puccinia coronata f. sp. avenae TaxID=200324 RepID=A0A2N5VI30_9BASI|nr:hypothetical protein PCANC_23773 [Puccinia coronata f. sp. avenae]PLW49651.1 hypothetical protein PCASD_02227 [Puccinia coronata f. sp. avenae]PLW56399.1 hypothetical protein PCANC_03438 [Puccinia coronata f. sp. avenae]